MRMARLVSHSSVCMKNWSNLPFSDAVSRNYYLLSITGSSFALTIFGFRFSSPVRRRVAQAGQG